MLLPRKKKPGFEEKTGLEEEKKNRVVRQKKV